MYRDTEGVLRWEGKFRTKSNAQTRLSEVLTEIHKGTYSRPSSLSFEQFAKEWLKAAVNFVAVQRPVIVL
jgi:hypothetical protein